MDINKLLKSNILYLDNFEDIKTLYHYTNVNGLKGIIDDANFNVSHAKFMNDKSEIIYSHDLIIKVINTFINNASDPLLSNLFTHFKNIITAEKHYVSSIAQQDCKFRAYKDRIPEFILSFSLNPDSINIWSSFQCQDGYNLGIDFFEFNKLLKNNKSGVVIPSKVIYDENRQIDIITQLINEYITIFQTNSSFSIEQYVKSFRGKIRLFANFFKNPKFKADEEFRFVFYNHDGSGYRKPNYRTRNNILVPYIQAINYHYNNENVEKGILPIKSITIGPTNFSDIALEGLVYFMYDKGYDIDRIDYINSGIPLRF